MYPRQIRLLTFARETFPTHRIDVEVLFGRELAGRGHRVDFVMQADSETVPPGPAVWHGCTVWVGPCDRRAGLLRRVRAAWSGVRHDLQCMKWLRKEQYDAVQVRDKFLIAAVLAIVAHARGLKFFYWLSFPLPESDMLRGRERATRHPKLLYARGLFFSRLLYRWILPRADHVFVQSELLKDNVVAQGLPAERITAVPMGIDVADIAPAALRHTPGEVVLGYIGTLGVERKLEILVDMLAELHRHGLRANLLLIGDGEAPDDRVRLEQRARDLQVSEYMKITGFLPRSKALELLRTAHVALSPIHPSPVLRVGSPTKLLEYLAMGLPVVANDQPEQRMILRECKAGVRVPWTARHFARGVRWILSRSESQRAQMGARGRHWVQSNRAYARIADKVEAKYLQVLEADEALNAYSSGEA